MATEPKEILDLFIRIAGCLPLAVKLKAIAFRSAGVKYANEQDLITGDGASYNGGRWNRPGVRAIYLSLDPLTAVQESYQEFLAYGFKASDIRPRVMAGVKLNVKHLLDLTDKGIRRELGFTLSELIDEDWHTIQAAGEESWTQAIGRGALRAGFEGLIVPSARNRLGKNFVIFPANLIRSSTIQILAKDELPPHPQDWPK